MRDLKIVLTKEQIVSKPHRKVCHYAKNDDNVYLTKIAKDDTLYYKIENNILYIRGTEKEGYSERVLYTDPTQAKNGWYLASNKGSITKAVIEEPIAPSSCCRFFDSCSGMTEIENFEYIEMAYCESCYCMFQQCCALQKINCTNWDVSKVTTMRCMFLSSTNMALTSIGDLSNWDVSKVTDTIIMFQYQDKITNITLPNNIKTIGRNMFNYCTSLASVTYQGTEYTSKSALTTALTNNGCTVDATAFDYTALAA